MDYFFKNRFKYFLVMSYASRSVLITHHASLGFNRVVCVDRVVDRLGLVFGPHDLHLDGTFGFFKKIGLNREIQLADEFVDTNVYFECDEPEFVKHLFSNEQVKYSIVGIHKTWGTITISRNSCMVKISPCEPLSKIRNEWIL